MHYKSLIPALFVVLTARWACRGVLLTFLGKYFTNISLTKLFRSDRGDKLSLADFQNYTQGEDLMLDFLPNVTVSTL